MCITPEALEIVKQLIGSFFSGRRKQLGLTQQELADKTGVRKSTIQRIEAGKFIPGGETLLNLIFELGLSLVFKSGEKNESFIQLFEQTWAVSIKEKNVGNTTALIKVDMAKAGMKIGRFFSEQRQKLGLTQRETADRARLGVPIIQRIECGHDLPDGKGLIKLCGALHCMFYPINFNDHLLIF